MLTRVTDGQTDGKAISITERLPYVPVALANNRLHQNQLQSDYVTLSGCAEARVCKELKYLRRDLNAYHGTTSSS